MNDWRSELWTQAGTLPGHTPYYQAVAGGGVAMRSLAIVGLLVSVALLVEPYMLLLVGLGVAVRAGIGLRRLLLKEDA